MAFAYSGNILVTFFPHDFGSETAMEKIGGVTLTVNAGGIGEEDADIVEHGGTIDEIAVDFQFGMMVDNAECTFGDLAAMMEQ